MTSGILSKSTLDLLSPRFIGTVIKEQTEYQTIKQLNEVAPKLSIVTEATTNKTDVVSKIVKKSSLPRKVFIAAENWAFEQAEESKSAVTGNAVLKHARTLMVMANQQLLEELENLVSKQYGKQEK